MRLKNVSALLALLIVFSGCRMYGGHGSEEATYAQIQDALERYEARADRLQSDYDALNRATAMRPALAPEVVVLAALQSAQASTLVFHREAAASVDAGSSYRSLSRALGAMITQQQIIEDQYGRIAARILDRSDLDRDSEARYAAVPAKLARIEGDLQQISIRDALQAN
jgi:hypothetical protein